MSECKKSTKIKFTRNIPYLRLEDDEVRDFLFAGWRVRSKSRGIYVAS